MPDTITIEYLAENGAGAAQVVRFVRAFGAEAVLTRAVLLRAAEAGVDPYWLAGDAIAKLPKRRQRAFRVALVPPGRALREAQRMTAEGTAERLAAQRSFDTAMAAALADALGLP